MQYNANLKKEGTIKQLNKCISKIRVLQESYFIREQAIFFLIEFINASNSCTENQLFNPP